ncbi:hypothetical protein STEG23_034970 [Scotinomys teguina]
MNQTREAKTGVIVKMASVFAFDGQTGQATYSTFKMGTVGMTTLIAPDLAPTGICVTAIASGLFTTLLLITLTEEGRDFLTRQLQQFFILYVIFKSPPTKGQYTVTGEPGNSSSQTWDFLHMEPSKAKQDTLMYNQEGPISLQSVALL